MQVLAGRSIIVTGGASGIGAAAARLAGERGARVTVADLSDDGGRSVVQAIRKKGGEAQYVQTDISKEDEVRALIQAATAAFGQLHGAFNNAGIQAYSHRPGNPFTAFADMSLEMLQGTLRST